MISDVDESLKVDLDKYGLGQVRKLEDYQAFSGVNLVNKTIDSKAKLGGANKEVFMEYLIEMIMKMKT